MSIEISFIIPVHNSAATLDRALDSVLNQSVRDIEVIAVNDGSADDSGKILSDRAAKDQRLKVITFDSNRGTLSARLHALHQACGKWVMFLDPDDEFTTDAAGTLLATAAKYPADIIHFHLKELCSGKRRWNWCPARNGMVSGHLAVVRDLLCDGGHYWNLCLKMIKREIITPALADIEDFYCIMCEDLYMDLAFELRANSIYKTDFAPYIYHTDNGVTTAKKRTLASFTNLISALKALELCTAMLPQDIFTGKMHDITVKQCRILLARCRLEVAETDQAAALAKLRDCGFCTAALAEAETMPPLAKLNAEDFLPGHPVLRQIIDFFLPPGSCRRLWFKTRIKRLLKRN